MYCELKKRQPFGAETHRIAHYTEYPPPLAGGSKPWSCLYILFVVPGRNRIQLCIHHLLARPGQIARSSNTEN